MGERVEKFVEHRASRRSSNTARQYRRGAKVFEEWLEATSNSMESLTVTGLDDFVGWMIKRGYRPASIRNYCTIGKLYTDFLRARGTNIPIFERPLLPKIELKRVNVLPDELIPSYLAACVKVASEPHRTALMMLPMTGLRVTEMCTLELDNVNFFAPSQARPHGGAEITVIGKGRKERSVTVLRQGVPALASYVQVIRPRMRTNCRWVFPHRNGKDPLRRQQVNARLDRVQAILGLDELYPHLLRHTYASVLNRSGISPFDLADQMGHGDVKTTGRYVHPDRAQIAEKVDGVGYDYEDNQ